MADYNININARDNTGRALNSIERKLNNLDGAAAGIGRSLKIAGAAAAAFATGAVARSVISQYTAFEKYRTVLATYLGTQEKANRALGALQVLANRLPQDLDDITSAFVLFKSRGIETTQKSLTAFSNIATANGKSLTQLGEAVADALTGEFERMKEFGIKVSKENDQFVADIGNGQKIIAGSTQELVSELVALGEEGGKFGSAAEEANKTLSQSFSNLTGAVFAASVQFGEGLKPELKKVVEQMTLLINRNQELIKQFGVGLGNALAGAVEGIKLIAANIDLIRNAMLTFIGIKSAQYFATMAARIAQFTGGAKTATGFIGGMSKAIKTLTIAPFVKLARFMGPTGLIVAGASAVAFAYSKIKDQTVQVGNQSATFSQVVAAGWDLIKEKAVQAFNNVLAGFRKAYNTIINNPMFQSIVQGLKEVMKVQGGVFAVIVGRATRVFQTISDAAAYVFNNMQSWMQAAAAFISERFARIAKTVVDWATVAQETFSEWYTYVSGVVNDIVGWFQWGFNGIMGYAKRAINFVVNTFVAMGQTVIGIAKNIPAYFGAMFRGIMSAAADFSGAVTQRFSNIGEAIALSLKGDFSGAMAKAGEEVGYSFADSIAKSFADVPSLVPNIDYNEIFSTDRLGAVQQRLATMINMVGATAQSAFGKAQQGIQDMLSGASAGLNDERTIFGGIVAGIREEVGRMEADFARGSAAVDGLFSQDTLDKIKNMGQTLVDMLPESASRALEERLRTLNTLAGEDAAMAIDVLKKEVEDLDDALGGGTSSVEDFNDSLGETEKKAKTVAGIIGETWKEMSENMSRGIAESIMAGKGTFNSFRDYLKGWANEVITKIIDRMLIQPMLNQMATFGTNIINQFVGGMSSGGGAGGGGLGSMLGGLFNGGGGGFLSGLGGMLSGAWGGISSFFGNMFGGFFANGGYLPSGKVGIAGEAGPELITGPARITSNEDSFGGGAPTINFNINAVTTQDGVEFILKNKQAITGVVNDAYNRRGQQGIYS